MKNTVRSRCCRVLSGLVSGGAMLLLSACASFSVTAPLTELVNQELVLHQPLVISPRQARVYFQQGRVLHNAHPDRYQPWCEFEIRTLRDTPQNLQADVFRILRVQTERSALLEGVFGFQPFERKMEDYVSVLYVQSERQPDVYRLSCLRRAEAMSQRYLNRDDMQQVLGAYFTFRIP